PRRFLYACSFASGARGGVVALVLHPPRRDSEYGTLRGICPDLLLSAWANVLCAKKSGAGFSPAPFIVVFLLALVFLIALVEIGVIQQQYAYLLRFRPFRNRPCSSIVFRNEQQRGSMGME